MDNNLLKTQPSQQPVSTADKAVGTLAAESGDLATALNPGLHGARVLLVDDSDVVRDITRAVLEDAGVVVEEAHDGVAAVRLLQADPARYALVLMDIHMPALDGIAATRMIRGSPGERMPPIVAFTAQASEQEKRTFLEAGMVDRVCKPVDPTQLLAVLNRWMTAPLCAVGRRPAPVAATADRAVPPQSPPDVPGFDLQAGLQCVGGNSQRLRTMLGRFGTRYAGVVAELHGLAAAEHYSAACRLAHTVKGAAATLGGTHIAQAAEQVERAMRQRCEPGRPVTQSAAETGDSALALDDLDAALQRALPVLLGLAVVSAPVANTRLRAAIPQAEVAEFDALRQLLADNCYAARKAFALLHDKLGAGDADWQAAAAAVDAMDFQQALARLNARYFHCDDNAV